MRSTVMIAAAALLGFGCSDASPTAPFADEVPNRSEARSAAEFTLAGAAYRSFPLAMAGAADCPSEAWGIFVVRAGLAPPNPCFPFARRFVSALTVCGIIYNPTEERLDAVTFEVVQSGAERPTVLRGFVSAPPNPCNVAILRGVFPADLRGVQSVTAVLETDQGVVVSGGADWPGALPAPPNPCVLTVTPG